MFFVPYIYFLFQSLKLIRQFSSSFDNTCRCSKLLKYFNKTGQIIRRFSLFLVLYIRFLFESPKLIRQFSSRFNQISGCSKLLKYFNKKGQIIRRFLLFLVPSIRFLFESLKLIKWFSSRFDQISGYLKLMKNFNIFEKTLPRPKFFLFHTSVSYFSTLHQKSFFLEQNQFLQLLKLIEILHQNFNFDFVSRITVPQWRRKKLLFI